MGALLDEGEAQAIHESSAKKTHPKGCDPRELLKTFESIYDSIKGKKGSKMDVMRALLTQERKSFARLFSWACSWTAVRLSTPFALRQFLIWLNEFKDKEAKLAEGFLWGLLLTLGPSLFMFIHHQMVRTGLMTGLRMRTTLISVIHAKILRLNCSSVARVTTGHIVNLVSNDARRFDDAPISTPFLLFGPFEAVFVLIAVSFVLGFVPAVAGMSCFFLLISSQAVLSKYIGKCRARTAKITDSRINLIGELISGCLAVKMLGWEDPLIADVDAIRAKEHKLLLLRGCIHAASSSISTVSQIIAVCITFITHRFASGEFNVPDVFFALSLMMLLRLSLAHLFLQGVEFGSEAIVAAMRVDAFLRISETPSATEVSHSVDRGTIEMHGGHYGWYTTESTNKANGGGKTVQQTVSLRRAERKKREEPQLRQTLTNVDLLVGAGELVGVAGMVGSGKSSLLSALLNEMETISSLDSSQVSGQVSFCSQTPWIVAGTVRENILFGRPFEDKLYWQVVQSCALDIDFEQFPDGDNTELGERGINISGGQKARVALARAAYSQADIHLLDDPLSAVDPRVGRILFDRCIGPHGLMKNSTRLLVTHQRQFLPLCDRIVLMDNGQIENTGKWDEVSDNPLLRRIEAADHPELSLDAIAEETDSQCVLSAESSSLPTRDNECQSREKSLTHRTSGRDQLVEAETKVTGKVAFAVYWAFVRHVGILSFVSAFSLLAVSTVLVYLSQWWVAAWASSSANDQEEMQWVWTLVVLSSLTIVTDVISIFSLYILLAVGSTRLHRQMMQRVFHAPLKFFHTNPSGRILNRFAKDMGVQDEELPKIGVEALIGALTAIGTFVLVSIALPFMLIIFAVVCYFSWRVCRRYVLTSREIKRFEGTTRSPVYAMISANLKGLSTIRAFRKEADFQERFLEALNLNRTWWSAHVLTSRWVGFRMDGIVALVMLFSVLLAILLARHTSSEILGLALTYSINLSGLLQYTMRMMAELENGMTAVERNLEYTKVAQEPPRAVDGGGEAPKGWPSKGDIEYVSTTASYRPGLTPVLRNLSFRIPGGSSVGIVGRTGSGKSSLLLTLFRLIDIEEGEIRIDGVNTASVGIDVLRRQLSVIPQDPVLFGGTLRSNLDPWNEQSEAKIWDTLQKVCLDAVAKEIGGLDAQIAEYGGNLSVGQRQLLCLARALLTDSKILALDEATANVDQTTDALIQQSLHAVITEKDKTLLIIAHRIDTVLHCDLIIVLDDGEVAEFGRPTELLSRRNGAFARIAEAARKASVSESVPQPAST